MNPTLRLSSGQQQLTPTQEAEAERFAEHSIRTQLSTGPVDEREAEAFCSRHIKRSGDTLQNVSTGWTGRCN
jgi:hypothetical protein